MPADGKTSPIQVSPRAPYANTGRNSTTMEINSTVMESLHLADKNNVKLTVANIKRSPASAKIICSCPRFIFGRLITENSI